MYARRCAGGCVCTGSCGTKLCMDSGCLDLGSGLLRCQYWMTWAPSGAPSCFLRGSFGRARMRPEGKMRQWNMFACTAKLDCLTHVIMCTPMQIPVLVVWAIKSYLGPSFLSYRTLLQGKVRLQVCAIDWSAIWCTVYQIVDQPITLIWHESKSSNIEPRVTSWVSRQPDEG